MSASILIVEDDPALRELLVWQCSNAGYAVRDTADGEEALIMVREQMPDLLLLDWMIENLPGIEVCRQIRKMPQAAQLPILMLTARGTEDDRVRGLNTGADDYVTKPFSTRELMARVEALLRRSRPASVGASLRIGDLMLDPLAHKVQRGAVPVHLGPTEFRLLRHFMERPARTHSRDALLNAVWGMDSEIDERTVDVHIRRLRKAINLPGTVDLIRTVRSEGYALDVDVVPRG